MSPENRRPYARMLMNQLRTDADFDAFVIDYYIEEKCEHFTNGMGRKQKVNLLLELVDTEQLIRHLQIFLRSSEHGPPESQGQPLLVAERPYGCEDRKGRLGGRRVQHLVLPSDVFVTEAQSLRLCVAEEMQEPTDAVEKLWLLTVGPPHSTLVVALIARQFVPFLLDEATETLTRLSFSPELRVASRFDTRSVGPVDLLGDGGRQLLLAADTAAGLGLGATDLFIFRLRGTCLEQIFHGEVAGNMLVGDSDYCEETITSYELWPASAPGKAMTIVATRCHTLGGLRNTETVRFEWDGRHYVPLETAAAREERDREQALFDAEFARIAQLYRVEDE